VSLYASAAILAEYEAVLSRPKFAAIGPDRIARLFAALKSEA
jgi:predicted nucleic acid-binding protein